MQLRQGFFQRVVKIVLQSELGGRREDACIDAIGLAISVLRDKQNLAWRGRCATRGLVVEPAARRKQNKNENQHDRYVVLPRTPFVGPKECA